MGSNDRNKSLFIKNNLNSDQIINMFNKKDKANSPSTSHKSILQAEMKNKLQSSLLLETKAGIEKLLKK